MYGWCTWFYTAASGEIVDALVYSLSEGLAQRSKEPWAESLADAEDRDGAIDTHKCTGSYEYSRKRIRREQEGDCAMHSRAGVAFLPTSAPRPAIPDTTLPRQGKSEERAGTASPLISQPKKGWAVHCTLECTAETQIPVRVYPQKLCAVQCGAVSRPFHLPESEKAKKGTDARANQTLAKKTTIKTLLSAITPQKEDVDTPLNRKTTLDPPHQTPFRKKTYHGVAPFFPKQGCLTQNNKKYTGRCINCAPPH
jgi:hypothetical protein